MRPQRGRNFRDPRGRLTPTGVKRSQASQDPQACKSGPVFTTLPSATRARLERLQSRGEVCGVVPPLSGLVAAAVAAGLPVLEREAGVGDLSPIDAAHERAA
jgi:hypothetical protein